MAMNLGPLKHETTTQPLASIAVHICLVQRSAKRFASTIKFRVGKSMRHIKSLALVSKLHDRFVLFPDRNANDLSILKGRN